MSYTNRCSINLPEVYANIEFSKKLGHVLGEDACNLLPDVRSDGSAEIFVDYCHNLFELVTFLQEFTSTLDDVLITMETTGEEFADHYVYYIMNGKVQEERAIFPEFNVDKLKDKL